MKIVRHLKEKNRWMLVCVAVLTIAAITISLTLLYTPQDELPPEESETVEDAVVTVPPRSTATPEPPPTITPVITPPAKSAASGSDVILQHVPRATESDLNDDPDITSQTDTKT